MISRQRKHQIRSGYKNTGRKGRESFYDLLMPSRCQCCFGVMATHLHHKDFDNKNDTIDNLLPVCHACHYRLHSEERLRQYWESVRRTRFWT